MDHDKKEVITAFIVAVLMLVFVAPVIVVGMLKWILFISKVFGI